MWVDSSHRRPLAVAGLHGHSATTEIAVVPQNMCAVVDADRPRAGSPEAPYNRGLSLTDTYNRIGVEPEV